jgi:trehalose 6-phosphate phosphatase
MPHQECNSASLVPQTAVNPVCASVVGAIENVAVTKRLLVALDFDGTLAPEVDDPAQARALPEAQAAILRLLDVYDTPVALISGRAMESLKNVTDLPDNVLLVGSHGIEIRRDDSSVQSILNPDEREQVTELGRILSTVADPIDNVWIESKPAGFALHTRLATPEDSSTAYRLALCKTKAEFDNLTIRRGKNVLEFSVRSTTKGEAVEYLRRNTAATAVFYAGDDVTDEDVFSILGPNDMGLKSGPGTTSAPYRVHGPHEVAEALNLLADARATTVAARL